MIIVTALVAIALVIAGTFFLVKKRASEDVWLCRNGIWEKHGNPSSPMPMKPCPAGNAPGQFEENSGKKLIGGDRDEHGCLTPAGYSWCETKQKCLRSWEEICPPN